MKFRAVITDDNSMKELLYIVQTMSKITKDIILNILPDKLIIIGTENLSRSIPFTWCSIEKSTYFMEYDMDGVNEEYNQIYLSVTANKLVNGFIQIQKNTPSRIKMKLSNKQFPCLTIQITIPLIVSADNREIVHDVPVTVIPVRDWNEFKIPILPYFDNTITLPSLRSLRNLIDKIKNFSPILTIYENCNTLDEAGRGSGGNLSIVIETDSATVTNNYRNLYVQHHHNNINNNTADSNQQHRQQLDSEEMDLDKTEISCKVSSKILATFLSSNQFSNVNMFCNIAQDHLLNIFLNIRDTVKLNCCILAISD